VQGSRAGVRTFIEMTIGEKILNRAKEKTNDKGKEVYPRGPNPKELGGREPLSEYHSRRGEGREPKSGDVTPYEEKTVPRFPTSEEE